MTAQYDIIRDRIATAAAQTGRKPDDITLIAVSKTRDVAAIAALADCGQKDFGENRIQEAVEKFTDAAIAPRGLGLHFIGRLQSNKAAEAVQHACMIHTLDREKLAVALGEAMRRQNRHVPCLLQINTGDEPQKGGIAARDAEKLLRFAREDVGLTVSGVMAIPPVDDMPDPHFALLHRIGRDLELPFLSMGMSDDFETAIRYGATHIRIGSALF